MAELHIADDGIARCGWCSATSDYIAYHDNEWGYPVKDDQRLFEKICLESFQSGLSWRTILTKRDNFRKAFKQFDFYQMAEFTEQDVERLLQDEGIVRHRGKIEAVINNAKRAIEMVEQEGSLAVFFWRFEAEEAPNATEVRATSPESVALSKALKKRGWKFVGPTTAYAFMQAMGLVNDHSEGCAMREKATQARLSFEKPE
ncbi:DNA-3-methyladenine glycosylase I [Thaumasiovibrio subtropicus]|uniref:DNA-3-methyladenine glycosylase I n=1 Tax=Thaumasiovibrio subtropicus TaxID=1891207 RepID=UPI000B35221C|nr:DNA-3-methyladenine glycosylase I [Thaumasiovibrio subtropicus]